MRLRALLLGAARHGTGAASACVAAYEWSDSMGYGDGVHSNNGDEADRERQHLSHAQFLARSRRLIAESLANHHGIQ